MAQGKKPKKKAGGSRSATAAQMAVRRQIWGGCYLFAAFLLCLALLHIDGFLLSFVNSFMQGLIGIGFYITPLVLGTCGILLIAKSRGKVRRQVGLILSLPFLLGAIGHVFSAGKAITFYKVVELYKTGAAGTSGGAISGFLGGMLSAAISPIGAGVFFIAAFVLCFVFAFNIRMGSLISRFRLPPEPEEVKKPPREARPAKEPAAQPVSLFGRKPKIDIALDGQTVEAAQEIAPPKSDKIDIAPPNVKTPAQVLRGENLPPMVEEPIKGTKNAQMALDITPEPPLDVPDIGKPKEEKVGKDELAAVAQQVSQEIEEMLKQHEESPVKSYLYPPISLLKASPKTVGNVEQEAQALAERLVDTLLSFGVDSTVVGVTRGPTVTRYELVLQRGTKFSRVSNLSDDIALALGASSVRISTIPDKLAIGIEVPNTTQQVVTIRDILDSKEFRDHSSKICFCAGRDITNRNVVGDITKMPHMLIAGTTGSGKSVCINSILISLLYKASPEEVRLIMIDPKMIELGVYNGIPHLLIPVVTDPKKASGALNWAVAEMMRRYRLLSEVGVRDLASYNAEVKSRGEGEALPQIVIVIDELADLMFVAANEVEEAIARIAQMARAAGMHLIIATQRPSADIITGIMKSNIPSRIAFAVASQIESRIILDTMGAEKLIGKGDMLYSPLGSPKPQRVQGCFITTAEVEAVVEFVKKTGTADYSDEILQHIEHAAENTGKGGGGAAQGGSESDDPMMNAAIEVVVETGQASVSMLQRRLKLGYSRAARLVDYMEERGIVGPSEGSKPRQVLITRQEWQEMVLRSQDN